MDSFMLQDEAVRDRIRQAEDFLDPSTKHRYPLQACHFRAANLVVHRRSPCAELQVRHHIDAPEEPASFDGES